MEVRFRYTPHVLSKLAEALFGGALPLLEHLDLYPKDLTEEELVLAANMVERRAQIPGCHALTFFQGNYNWLSGGTRAEIRLLRALLPSLKSLSGGVHWHAAFDPCVRDICPPYLEVLDVRVEDEAFPSLEVLEAAPALKKIRISPYIDIGAAAFQPVIAALHRGVDLRSLKEVDAIGCILGDVHFSDFLGALKSSGCAERMLRLTFFKCGIGVDGARALAELLHGDGLPALEELDLSGNDLFDEGVVALAGGLRKAPRTMLKIINLRDVGMGEAGMAGLASVIYQGRMNQMRTILAIIATRPTTA